MVRSICFAWWKSWNQRLVWYSWQGNPTTSLTHDECPSFHRYTRSVRETLSEDIENGRALVYSIVIFVKNDIKSPFIHRRRFDKASLVSIILCPSFCVPCCVYFVQFTPCYTIRITWEHEYFWWHGLVHVMPRADENTTERQTKPAKPFIACMSLRIIAICTHWYSYFTFVCLKCCEIKQTSTETYRMMQWFNDEMCDDGGWMEMTIEMCDGMETIDQKIVFES